MVMSDAFREDLAKFGNKTITESTPNPGGRSWVEEGLVQPRVTMTSKYIKWEYGRFSVDEDELADTPGLEDMCKRHRESLRNFPCYLGNIETTAIDHLSAEVR
jgi:hypothetical protein